MPPHLLHISSFFTDTDMLYHFDSCIEDRVKVATTLDEGASNSKNHVRTTACSVDLIP